MFNVVQRLQIRTYENAQNSNWIRSRCQVWFTEWPNIKYHFKFIKCQDLLNVEMNPITDIAKYLAFFHFLNFLFVETSSIV